MYHMYTYACPYCRPTCQNGGYYNNNYMTIDHMHHMNEMTEINNHMNYPMHETPGSHINDYYSTNCNTKMSQRNDHGEEPFVINIENASERNNNFRTAIWTGKYLQVTLMSLRVDEDIGLELHPDVDQFLRIEKGCGLVRMGDSQNNLYFEKNVSEDDAIMVPAGMWHNLINTGNESLKLYSIYAPPEHPFGTIHRTKKEALAAEEDYR